MIFCIGTNMFLQYYIVLQKHISRQLSLTPFCFSPAFSKDILKQQQNGKE